MRISVCVLFLTIMSLPAVCPATDEQSTGELVLIVTGMKNTSGFLNIAVSDSEAGFLEKDKATVQIRTRIHGPEVSLVIRNLPLKDYAVSAFHDENGNNTLDRNVKGIPKERYGFSNNARGKTVPPSYGMSRFSLQPASQTMRITLH